MNSFQQRCHGKCSPATQTSIIAGTAKTSIIKNLDQALLAGVAPESGLDGHAEQQEKRWRFPSGLPELPVGKGLSGRFHNVIVQSRCFQFRANRRFGEIIGSQRISDKNLLVFIV
jgi:hypothetical protein